MSKLFIIIAISALALGSFYFWQNLQPNFTTAAKYPLNLYVAPGISFDNIANQTQAAGLIKSKTIFKIYALLTGKADRLQNGYYEIEKPVSIPALIGILTRGPEELAVTILPGETLKEIDDDFSQLKIIQAKDLTSYQDFDNLKKTYPFLNEAQNLEGYLLPDTYHFYRHSDPNFVIKKILDNFRKQVLTNFPSNANLTNTLKIASLLEKEISNSEDQRIVAGIITKRLKIKMPLQIDAAILYGKCLGRFINCPNLTKKDFQTNSLYNTYLHVGLPPTPICNPGEITIKAVLEKQNSKYWYYLSNPKTKKTIFSTDLNEQTKNRFIYLR